MQNLFFFSFKVYYDVNSSWKTTPKLHFASLSIPLLYKHQILQNHEKQACPHIVTS